MGSMFDEIKKLKQQIQVNQPISAPQQVRASRTNIPFPTQNVSVCPKCGLKFASESISKHLKREHGIVEDHFSSGIRPTQPGSKPSVQNLSGDISKAKTKGLDQSQSRSTKPQDTTIRQSISSGRKNRPSVRGDGQNASLDGYIEKIIKLPTGGTHRILVKHTELSNPQQNISSTNALSLVSAPGKKTSPSKQQLEQRPHKQPTQEQKKLSPEPKRFFKLSNTDDYKLPAPWVAYGKNTTLSGSGTPIPIYMGIDFGTAFTKASIGFGGSDIFIVDWAGIKNGHDQFTLPGEFSVLEDGTCVVGRSPSANRVATDLKLPFLEGHASQSSLVDATIFLALVMRYIRGWWFHNHMGLIKTKAIEWNINLGAPTTPWQDNKIRNKYVKAAKAAWVMSCSDKPISVDHAQQLLISSDLSCPPVEIVPEFVAQIASYTRSPQRQPDLHLLVDVGAGTVDVVTFNVHQDENTGEDIFPIFWASVSNLGTHYLMSRRLHEFPHINDEHWNDATTVPNASVFARLIRGSPESVSNVDRIHTSDVAQAIATVLRTTKLRRYRNSPNWQEGIRVFFCGGGSSCDTFAQSIALASKLSGFPLSRLGFPIPGRLKANSLPSDQFHRVSVAYGLGMDVFNLGNIIPIAEVENDTPVNLPHRGHNTDFEDK